MVLFKKLILKALIFTVIGFLSNTILLAQLTPNLVFPDNNDSCLTQNLTFVWDTVPDAAAYKIEISSSSTWTNPDIDSHVLTHPSSTYSFVLPDANTTYYWRVSSSFTNNQYYSATRKFTTQGIAPTQIYPADQSSCIELQSTFEWSTMTGADSYDLQISTSNTFSGLDLKYDISSIPTDTLSSTTYSLTMQDNYRNYYWRLRSHFGDCLSEWSDPAMFSTMQAAPNTIAPENNSLGVAITTSLTWSEITPSSTYDVDFASDANFNNIISSYNGLSQTSTTIPTLSYNTNYFWRARTELNSCTSHWSNIFKFKTAFPATNLTSPYDGRICLPLIYKFEWTLVSSSQSYELQISEDADFSNIVIDESSIFDLNYIAELPKGLTKYYWRVRAKDTDNYGLWSNVRSFTTTVSPVEPLAPQPNSGGISLNTVFKWHPVSNDDLAFYHFQLSESPTFADTLVDVMGIDTNEYALVLSKNNTEYYWRVSASYSQCENSFSTPWKFKTIIAPPVLTSPSDSSTKLSFSVFFDWNDVPDAESYEIFVATTPDFSQLFHGMSAIPVSDYYLAGLDPDTRYYWHVRAINQYGESQFSEAFTFTTSTKGAEIPKIVSPTPGAEQLETDLDLEWTEALRADAYHLVIGTNQDFKKPFVDVDTLTSTTYHLSGLLNNTEYYWHVSAINDSGETHFSNLGSFTTKMLAPVDKALLLLPENNSTNQNLRVVLQWNGVTHATSYDVQIAKDETFTDSVNYSVANYNIQKTVILPDYDTKYFWRVRGVNITGKGPWSDPYNLTTKVYVSVNDEMSNLFEVEVYPNPFSDIATIRFTLPQANKVAVKIYNLLGNEVATLINREMNSGQQTVLWQAPKNATGIYYYSVQIGTYKMMKKIVVIK